MGTATTVVYTYVDTLSLHDALPISGGEVELAGAQSESMEAVLDGLRRAGVVVPVSSNDFTASSQTAPRSILNGGASRSEEHMSELQSLMRISYAVFGLKKKTNTQRHIMTTNTALRWKQCCNK